MRPTSRISLRTDWFRRSYNNHRQHQSARGAQKIHKPQFCTTGVPPITIGSPSRPLWASSQPKLLEDEKMKSVNLMVLSVTLAFCGCSAEPVDSFDPNKSFESHFAEVLGSFSDNRMKPHLIDSSFEIHKGSVTYPFKASASIHARS